MAHSPLQRRPLRDAGRRCPSRDRRPRRPHRTGSLGGVQPGWQDPGQRQRRWHSAAVGCGHPPPDRRTPSPASPTRSSRWRSARTARSWPAAATTALRLWDVATRQPIGSPLTGHTGAVTRWRSARTARPWPAAATMARCGCGTWPPASRSGAPHRPHCAVDAVAFSPDGKTLASGSDDGTVRLWDVATRRQIGNPLTGHTGRLTRWRSARTARPWPAAARWHRAAVGRGHPPADRAASLTGIGVRSLGGVQPGRQDPGHRRRRRHGAAVGCGHPPADREPSPATPSRRLGGVQPGRQDPGQRQRRSTRCGCGMWPPAARSATPSAATPTRHLGGVQPGRQDPGQRQR